MLLPVVIHRSGGRAEFYYMGYPWYLEASDTSNKRHLPLKVLKPPLQCAISAGSRLGNRLRLAWWKGAEPRRLKPDVVQVSAAREILVGLAARGTTRCKLVHDAREDYFRQAYDYGGKRLKGLK